MISLRPGWMVAVSAAVLSVAAWLPWVVTGAGRGNAIGGTHGDVALPARFGAGQGIVLLASALLVAGAMAARGISARWASVAALGISLAIAALTGWFHRLYVGGAVSASYGWYLGAAAAVLGICCSVWALVDALRTKGPQ